MTYTDTQISDEDLLWASDPVEGPRRDAMEEHLRELACKGTMRLAQA